MIAAARSQTDTARATRILYGTGKELQAATEQVDRFESRLQGTEQLLAVKREQRLAQCSPALYDACWDRATEAHKHVGYCVATAALCAGAAGGGYLMLAGYPQLSALVALGSLVATFKAVPQVYAGVIKKWVLPGQMDKLVTTALERERVQLQNALIQARKQKEQLAAGVEADLRAAATTSVPEVRVEEAFVTIGGVKVPVRK